MKGTKSSLCANISAMNIRGKIRARILLHILPLYLTLPRRINFTHFVKWGDYCETTYHNWFKKDLDLVHFNRELIDTHGSGSHFTIFDPSFINKSGKKTKSIGHFWSGCLGTYKRGLEMSCFAVGDIEHHTAYHLTSTITPAPKSLKEQGQTLIDYYVSQVQANLSHIQHFGNLLVADGYFGVSTYVQPILAMGIDIISCLKPNVCLYYVPPKQTGERKRGRPAKKDGKIDWKNIDNDRLPIVEQNNEKIVRSGLVYVKCLKMTVLLVAVDYLKEDGSSQTPQTPQTRKLYFSNRTDWDFKYILQHYHGRCQIEFLFRDAKQYTGLMHCQSTDETKLQNHLNISLSSVSVAKATHWNKEQPFSMNDIKNYYYNLKMVDLFSDALGLEPNSVKNNPKIERLLFSMNYTDVAA